MKKKFEDSMDAFYLERWQQHHPCAWYEDGRLQVATLVGEIDFDATRLKLAIKSILQTSIDDLPKSPLTLRAARRFEQLAEELCISSQAEIDAMHAYFTLLATRDVFIEMVARDIHLPFWIDGDFKARSYPRE
jgi:hypothetical protein